jgi:hypothetical protein
MLPSWLIVTNHIFTVEIQVIFWLCVLFITVYSWLAPWWSSTVGRSLVMMDAALAVGIFPDILGRYFHVSIRHTEWVAFLDVACFTVIPLVVLSRVWLVIKVNWKNERMLPVRQRAARFLIWVTALPSRLF